MHVKKFKRGIPHWCLRECNEAIEIKFSLQYIYSHNQTVKHHSWSHIPTKNRLYCHFDSQFNLFTDKSCFFIEMNRIKINHKKNPFSFLVYVHLQCTFSSQHLGFICNQQLPFQQRYYVSMMFFLFFIEPFIKNIYLMFLC